MISSSEKILILDRISKEGYRGFDRGKFHVYDSTTTVPKSVLAKLSFPKILEVEGLYHLAVKYKNLVDDIVEILRSVPFIAPDHDFKNPETLDEVSSPNSSGAQVGIIRDDIALFKTVRTDGVIDPGAKSTGISVLAFNMVSRVLLDARKISINGLLAIKKIKREEVVDMESIPFVWPEFNPYTPDIKFSKYDPSLSNKKIECLNTAIPPRWMTHASKDIKPGLSPFLRRLIYHLFPYDIERELVLDWCHYAIFKRNGTVLCLAGDRGTGKSTFVEILGELVGNNYTELVSEAILKDKFNAQFHNKRLIVFEEVALEDSLSVNKIKAWCNDKISIEEKGTNAFSADNFSSMVFLINKLEELKVTAQERRFSIPVVAEENLLTVMDEKEITIFKQAIVERKQWVLDEIAAFGLMLKDRKPKNSEYVPIKGENFNRVADLALTEWQSHLRDFVQANGVIKETIPISVIFPIAKSSERGEGMRAPTKKSTIENFLRDYRFLGKHKIGDVVDLTEAEFSKGNNMSPARGPQAGNGRTRRMYGIKPREQFLVECGLKYKRDEDLL